MLGRNDTKDVGRSLKAPLDVPSVVRVAKGEIQRVAPTHAEAGPQFTTAEMLRMERDTVRVIREGEASTRPVADAQTRVIVLDWHPKLNLSQREATEQILTSWDKITALDGVARAGDDNASCRSRSRQEAGYKFEGFAPTSRGSETG